MNISKKKIVSNIQEQMEKNDSDFDFKGLIRTLIINRKILIISIIVCFFLGIIVALFSKREYVAYSIMVPQVNNSSRSQLSGLASLAGLDLGMAQSAELSPIIYPKIVNSVPFKLELMNSSYHFENIRGKVTLYDFLTKYNKPSVIDILKKYTIGLPRLIINSLAKKKKKIVQTSGKEKMPLSLSKSQYLIKMYLDRAVSLVVEKKEGYLTLIVNFSEPLAAAEITQKAQEILQREITKFKVEKSQADLNFIQGRYNSAKDEVEKYQLNVAVNTDRFKNLTSTVPQVGTARLQSKFNVANNVFLELAKQLEQAKIQVKKDTPVFTIVDPVVIPSEPSKPNRPFIIIAWLFFGIILGISIIYGRIYIRKFKNEFIG